MTGCVRLSDPASDQVIFFGYPPDTTGMGLPSLDITRVQATMTSDGFTLQWNLSDLQRPAPGQSWLYAFHFFHAETEFNVVAQMQAISAPPGTVVTDRFGLNRVNEPTATSVPLEGHFDEAKHTVSVRVHAHDLGVASTRSYTVTDFRFYASQVVGGTVGVDGDDLFSPSSRLVVGTHSGC